MKTILKLPTTAMAVDFNKKIAVGLFKGDVTFEDYKEMLLAGAELARQGRIDSILMDRRQVGKLDAQCRIWVKNEYFKNHIKPIVPKMKRVAVVQSNSMIGQIYGNTIYKTLSLIYPNLAFKNFKNVKSAMKWIELKEQPVTMVAEDFLDSQEKILAEQQALLKDYSDRNKEINKKREIIRESNRKQKELALHDDIEESKTSFFDKVFQVLFPHSKQ